MFLPIKLMSRNKKRVQFQSIQSSRVFQQNMRNTPSRKMVEMSSISRWELMESILYRIITERKLQDKMITKSIMTTRVMGGLKRFEMERLSIFKIQLNTKMNLKNIIMLMIGVSSKRQNTMLPKIELIYLQKLLTLTNTEISLKTE